MAKVSVWDNDGVEHIKEPVDARECVEHLGWSNSAPEAKVVEQKEMTAKQLKDALNSAGVEFSSNASKAELQELFDNLNQGN